MSERDGFYTFKGYQLNDTSKLSSSMEDYLEMICRILQSCDVVRINELADQLHVKPSSASKMVSNLKKAGLIESKKYGYIVATNKGIEIGHYLLYRHEVLHDFLCVVNHSDNELEQVEKIEHFINKATIENLQKLTHDLIKAANGLVNID